MHIIFYCILVLIQEILSNSRTHGESWGFCLFSYLNFSQIWKEDHFGFNYFSLQNISNIKNKREEIKWLLQNKRNIVGKMLKSNKNFISILFAILFELEKYAFFRIAFLGQKNVHSVLNISFRWWKLFFAFLEFIF